MGVVLFSHADRPAMPTPVSSARQCLTDEAARALDDAVSVARRRCHPQTTSLHAVSALLSLPSSTLRDACSRARSCTYAPRLQFRALELSVGVSLDRLPSSKSIDEPPVSNSLMAAIKRSQANQRRNPESFHLYQIHNHQQSASVLKVELKYFILSILDDPIVSRVFGEAGFRSCDIKIAVMHPPTTASSQSRLFSRSRCPPIFLCNLTDTDTDTGHRNGFAFPFSPGGVGFGGNDNDANCRRIGEVLVKRIGKNPLLIGVYAVDALRSFIECVKRCKFDLFPSEVSGVRIVCIEKEILEFVIGNGSKEDMDLKFKEVFGMVQHCSEPGLVVNYGELSALISEGIVDDALSFVVSQLMSLLKLYSSKVWLIGAVGSFEMYEKFLARFPDVEKDWDLHLLPITSKSLVDGVGAKSRRNYLVWKVQVLSSLRGNNLDGFILKTRPCPPRLLEQAGEDNQANIVVNPDHVSWVHQDQVIFSWLLSTMTESLAGTVVNCRASHEIWAALARAFGSQARARTLQLRVQLQTTRKGSFTITEFFKKMRGIANSLTVSGTPISDDDLLLNILGGLPLEYDFVIVNIMARQGSPSLEEVFSLLLNQESRLKHYNSVTSTEVHSTLAANVAFTNTQNTQCRNPGHSNNSHSTRFGNNGTNGNYGNYNRGRGRGRNSRGRGNNRPTC